MTENGPAEPTSPPTNGRHAWTILVGAWFLVLVALTMSWHFMQWLGIPYDPFHRERAFIGWGGGWFIIWFWCVTIWARKRGTLTVPGLVFIVVISLPLVGIGLMNGFAFAGVFRGVGDMQATEAAERPLRDIALRLQLRSIESELTTGPNGTATLSELFVGEDLPRGVYGNTEYYRSEDFRIRLNGEHPHYRDTEILAVGAYSPSTEGPNTPYTAVLHVGDLQEPSTWHFKLRYTEQKE